MTVSEWIHCPHCRKRVKLPHYCEVSKVAIEPAPRVCVNCKHYKPNEAVREHGECYLHPPQLARHEDTWVRPAVMWNHHCGQFAVNTELL